MGDFFLFFKKVAFYSIEQYIHTEHILGTCIIKMHTSNTNTHKKSHRHGAKSYKTEVMPMDEQEKINPEMMKTMIDDRQQ